MTMKSNVAIPRSSSYIAQGAPPKDPPYFEKIKEQVSKETAPYLQNNASLDVSTRNSNTSGNMMSSLSADEITTSLENEKKRSQALDKNNNLLTIANRGNSSVDQTKDYDSEPHGFDISDKMNMLGSVAVGGAVGAAEVGARAFQLLTKVSKKGSIADLMGKEFTDWFNRAEARNDLIQEAIASHPTIYELGKFGGSIAASAPLAEGAFGLAAKVAPEIGAGVDAAMSAIKTASTNGAAKAILNSKHLSTALQLAKVSGKGAVIGETQYDPENNHFLNQALTGAALGLAFHTAGKLIMNLAEPAKNSIQELSQKFGVSLPIKANWEKVASYIPFSGYEELIQKRAQQTIGAAETIAKPIIKEGKQAILKDLGKRERDLTVQLSKEGLSDYDRNGIQKSLDSLQEQKDLIGTSSGYNSFLSGKLRQSFEQSKKEEASLYSKVDEKMKDAPFVEMKNTSRIAQEINKEQQDVLTALRKPKLLNITSNLLNNNEIKEVLQKAGITDSEHFSNVVNEIFRGGKVTGKDFQAVSPFLGDITEALKREGFYGNQKDLTDPLQQLLGNARFDYKTFRSNMQEVGSRISDSISPKENGSYKRLYGAMAQDLKDHIQTHGKKETLDLFNQANKIHQENVAPFYHAPLNAYRTDDLNADNFIGKFFKPDETTKASRILEQMPKGDVSSRLAAKAAVMNEAMNRAQTISGFNPIKFISFVKNLGETNKVIFSKEENAAFDGYNQLIKEIHRISKDALKAGVAEGAKAEISSQYAEKKHLIELGGLGGGAWLYSGHPALFPVMLTVAMSSWGFGKLMTSSAGRKLMVQLSELGEKASKNKLNPILMKATKLLGLYGGIQPAVSIGRGM